MIDIHYLWFAEVSAGRVRQQFDVEKSYLTHWGGTMPAKAVSITRDSIRPDLSQNVKHRQIVVKLAEF